MIKVSVIIPVFNAEKYLSNCLNSVVGQTLSEIEIIVINDGSTDESLNILKHFSSKYNGLIKVVNQENKGISISRNKGIELAKGEYVAFLDSDDTMDKDMLKDMYYRAKNDFLDIVVCDYTEVRENTEKRVQKSIDVNVLTNLMTDPNIIFRINTSPWNKLYNRNFLIQNKIYFPEKVKYEDAVFVLKAIRYANKIGKISNTYVNYLIRSGSETTSMDERIFDIFNILDMINEQYEDCMNNDSVKMSLEYFNIRCITTYVLQQRYQSDISISNHFIDEGYRYLDKHYPNWRTNLYFKQFNSFIKRILKKNKKFSKIVVNLLRKGSA